MTIRTKGQLREAAAWLGWLVVALLCSWRIGQLEDVYEFATGRAALSARPLNPPTPASEQRGDGDMFCGVQRGRLQCQLNGER